MCLFNHCSAGDLLYSNNSPPQPSYQHFKGVAMGTHVDAEKRMRKQTTWALGNTLVEGCKVVEENHFLFDILKSCGDTLVSHVYWPKLKLIFHSFTSRKVSCEIFLKLTQGERLTI